jgi:hypothetical protein
LDLYLASSGMRIIGTRYHGHAPRLPTYDYTAPGVYFITLCSWGRRQVFGKVQNGRIHLTGWGRIVEEEWLRTPSLRPYVRLDAYITMPDHFHGILIWDRDPFEPMNVLGADGAATEIHGCGMAPVM